MIKDIRGPTSRENELVWCCARVSPSPDARSRIDELVRLPLDWSTVLNRSWWHRVRPLVFRHLDGHPSGTMPEEVREVFVEFVEELAQRNRQLFAVLGEVSAMFEDAQLRGLVFKGPTLAQDAYGDLTLRECGDLDLLIHPSDFPSAKRLLVENGFTSCWDSQDSNQQVFACEFERRDAVLDVHWDLAPGWLNYHVNFDRLWSAGESLSEGSSFLRKLRAEDAISVLCIHGTKHWWERLRWICDVAELVNSGRVSDWDRVEATAIETRCRRSVSLGLFLAGDLLAAELPIEAESRLAQAAGISRLGAQVKDWLEHAERGKEMRKVRERFLFRMGVCERGRDRVPQIIHYLFARRRGADE